MKQQRLLCDSLTFSAHDSRRHCNLHDCVQLRRLETEFLALQQTTVLLTSHKLAQQQLTKNYKSMAVRSGMLTPACTYAQMNRQPKNIQMKPRLLNGQRHENTLMLILCNEWRNNNRLKSSLKFKQHLVKQESTFWIGKKIKMHTVSVIRIEYNHCDRLKRFQAISSQQNWLADSIINLLMAWNFRPYPTNIRCFVISL